MVVHLNFPAAHGRSGKSWKYILALFFKELHVPSCKFDEYIFPDFPSFPNSASKFVMYRKKLCASLVPHTRRPMRIGARYTAACSPTSTTQQTSNKSCDKWALGSSESHTNRRHKRRAYGMHLLSVSRTFWVDQSPLPQTLPYLACLFDLLPRHDLTSTTSKIYAAKSRLN